MSKMEFTDKQKEAIATRDKNIIVSAAAGSGKTSVLVTRIIRLVVDDKKDISKFVIVTFTNKASVEMKDRIRAALEEELGKDGADYSFIKEQIKNLKYAQIKTLHSFCADMLRENFYYFDNLSPSFKVISDNTSTILMAEAMDDVFSRAYEKMDTSFENFLKNFSENKNDDKAKDIIYKTYDKIMSQVRPIEWLDKMCEDQFSLDDFKKEVKKTLSEILKVARYNYQYTLDMDMRDKHQELIFDDFSKINDLDLLIDKDWDRFIKNIQKISFGAIRKSKKDNIEDYDFIKNTRNNYKNSLKEISKFVKNTDSETIEIFVKKEVEILSEINKLVKDFITTYQALKEEKSYLDFSDMEHKFIDLIDIDEAREKLRSSFDYIFFDEYQDSNEIQNYIIEALKGEDNLFFVGDVKQSIYGFRRAEPRLFLEKLETYYESNNSLRINLNKNFRSEKDILDFDNFIFDRLMTKESSDIDYKNGGHRLNPAKDTKTENKKVHVNVIDQDIAEEDYLVDLIEEIVSDGYDYKDIAILLRSGTKSYLYEEAFKKAEIPFFNDISKVSFGAVEVSFFINMLKYLVNPKDDLTLLSILRSEIFNFSEEDLVKIRLASDSYSFVKAFESYDNDDELVAKINDFNTIFTDLSYISSLVNLYEFGNYLFEKTGFYKFLLARDRAEERIANVEGFIDLMDDYDRSNDNGLYGFISYVDKLSKYRSDDMKTSRDLSENENLVRIMTIHKSKGLEFPVVILAEASKRFSNQDLKQAIVFDDELGIGINLSDYDNKLRFPSIKKNLILDRITENNKKEEMRALYVAMTRAEERLYITGNRNLKTINKLDLRRDFLKISNYLDWILAILSTDKVSEDLFDNYETDLLGDFSEINIITEASPIDKYQNTDISEFLEDDYVNSEVYIKFKEIFDKTYPYTEDTNESIKKSVTEISKDFDPSMDGYSLPTYESDLIATDFKKPNFIEDVKVYKPVDKGTIIHKAFQALEFKDYDENEISKSIDKLIEERKIDKDTKNIVEIEKLLAFFNDPYIKKISKEAKNIRKEESFLMEIDDYYVNGQIDLLFEMDNDLVLIDFKTDRKKRGGLYDRQIAIYKEAIEKALGKKVKKSMIYWYNFKEFSEIK